MTISLSFKKRTTRWLAVLLVSFMVLAPASPVFVIAEDGSDGPPPVPEDIGVFIENITQQAEEEANSDIQPILDDPIAFAEQEAERRAEEKAAEEVQSEPNSSSPESNSQQEDDGNNSLSLEETEEILLDPVGFAEQEAERRAEEKAGEESTSGSSSGSSGGVYARSAIEQPDLPDADEIIRSVPKTREEVEEYRKKRYDEQSVNTEDASNIASTQSNATTTPTTVADNDVSGDDSLVSNTASTTVDADISSDNYLEQDNVTSGQAVSGNNLLASGKDVLKATIETGTSNIASDAQVKGNTNSYQTIYGGGGDWVQKSFGSEASNSNSGDDNALGAEAQEVRSLTVVNKNLAFIRNVKDLLAKSGGNRISGASRVKDGGIFTGASRAKSSLLNLINTNTVNSAFLPLTFDIFDNFSGNINILELLFEAFGANLDGPSAITATATNKDSGDDSVSAARARTEENVNISNDNEGYIHNEYELNSISGQNSVWAGRKAKDIKIKTDRADVANNLINFLNTNLYESRIGVVVINVFADWAGNLILPGAAQFAQSVPDPLQAVAQTSGSAQGADDSLSSAIATVSTDLDIVSDNQAGVNTQIEITANTGDNFGLFDKDGKEVNVKTGQARTLSNLLTLANRDIVGTAFSHGFFNILGDWSGSLVGAPGSARVTGEGGHFIVADEAAALSGEPTAIATASNELEGADDPVTQAVAEVKRSVKLNNRNQGRVDNRLKILADSGTNDVVAYKGERVDIETGDAQVANNVSTFLNNNFSFSKGLTVALNVFGDWQGNIAYDEFTDLSTNIDLLSDPATLGPGSEVRYEVEVRNSGTEPTAPGTLSFSYDPSKYELIDAAGASVSGSTLSWPYGAFESAERLSRIVTLRLRSDLAPGQHSIGTASSITSQDFNSQNNSASESFALAVADSSGDVPSGSAGSGDDGTFQAAIGDSDPSDSGQGDSGSGSPDSGPSVIQGGSSGSGSGGGGYRAGNLLVSKTVQSGGPFGPGDSVSYQVNVQNTGTATVQNVVAYDVLRNGVIESEASWPLDDIVGGEEVIIEYEIELKEEAPTDTYTNTAYASGFDAANQVVRSQDVSTSIEVFNPDMPVSGSGGSGGIIQGGDIGVIDAFNRGATSTADITRDEADTNGVNLDTSNTGGGELVQIPAILTAEEETAIERSLEEQILGSANITRQLVPAAQAAGNTGDLELAGSHEIAGASSTRLAVYPGFLEFDGLSQQEPSPEQGNASTSIFSHWLLWVILVFILIAAYISFKEKQRKFSRW